MNIQINMEHSASDIADCRQLYKQERDLYIDFMNWDFKYYERCLLLLHVLSVTQI